MGTTMNDGTRESCDLMIRNGHVLVCDAARTRYPSGAVAIKGAAIQAVGPDDELARRFRPARVLDASGGLVHPGLMDLHYHVTYHMVGKMIAEADFAGEDPGPWV